MGKRQEYKTLLKETLRYLREEKAEGETDIMTKPRKMMAAYAPYGAEAPPVPAKDLNKDSGELLSQFHKRISGCLKCPLGSTRTTFVFGVGNPQAELMFIGEGPGFDEDRKGEPFVGAAGQLLNKIILAMSMKREEVYITNMVKCHPMIDPKHPEKRGNDRPPIFEEMAACNPYLQSQIAIIKPKILCALGGSAAKFLLQSQDGITKLRGRFYPISLSLYPDLPSIPLMPTYHPAALLRNPSLKKEAWEDMKLILKKLKELS